MPLFNFTDASFKIARCVEVWRKSMYIPPLYLSNIVC